MSSEITVSFSQIFDSNFMNQVFGNIDISEKTQKDYLYRIERFKKFILSRGIFDRNSLLEYKRELSIDSSITVTTKNKFLIVSRIFCQQLYRIGILRIDISTGVKSFKLNVGIKTNGFSENEIQKIIASLNKLTDIRLKTILTLKMFSGLRDIEIVRLTVENINLQDSMINVHGKGRDTIEPLPIVQQVSKSLSDYLSITKKKSGFLFTSESKRNKGEHLTTKTVWMMVRNFLNQLGINRNPHQFRSFFTTNLVKNMENLFDVITFTRHRNIQTLQNYVNQIGKEKIIPQYKSAFDDFVLS